MSCSGRSPPAAAGYRTRRTHPMNTGSSRKTSSGQATLQIGILGIAGTKADTVGDSASGTTTAVPTIRTTNSVVDMATSPLASRVSIGANGAPAASATMQYPILMSAG